MSHKASHHIYPELEEYYTLHEKLGSGEEKTAKDNASIVVTRCHNTS